MRGPLDVGAFEKALGELVDRHESLRTTIAVDRGEPVQVVSPDRSGPLVEVATAAARRPTGLVMSRNRPGSTPRRRST